MHKYQHASGHARIRAWLIGHRAVHLPFPYPHNVALQEDLKQNEKQYDPGEPPAKTALR